LPAAIEPAQQLHPTQPVRWATVIYGLRGKITTEYFSDGWQILREVDLGTNEQTDYNYRFDGFEIAERHPAGDRVCRTEDLGRPLRVTRLPAPGYQGSQALVVKAFTYNTDRFITDETDDADGTPSTTHYERDPSTERIIRIDRSVGNGVTESTKYDYDPSSQNPNPIQVTAPGGSITQYQNYDPAGAAPRLTLVGADGQTPLATYAEFDSFGRVVEKGRLNGSTKDAGTRFLYADTGRVKLEGRRRDQNSSWADTTYALATGGIQPLTTAVRGEDPGSTGLLSGMPLFFRVTTSDTNGHVVTMMEQPRDGSESPRYTCFHYSPDGLLLEKILPEGNSVVNVYDSQNRLVATQQGTRSAPPTDAWAQACVGNTTNWAGDLTTLTTTDFAHGFLSATTNEGVRTTVTTDGFGRTIQEVDPIGRLHERGYDSRGRVIWEALLYLGPGSTFPAYAKPALSAPNIKSLTEYAYDDLGRQTLARRWHLEDQTPLDKTTQYLDQQRTVIVTDAGLQTITVRDGAGRTSSVTLPDSSGITYQYPNPRTIQEYHRTNNPTKPTQVRITTLDGAGVARFVTDDANTLLSERDRDVFGHVTRAVDLAGSAVTDYGYDAYGRLKTERKTFSTSRVQTAFYQWDRNDRRIAVTDADNNTTRSTLDGLDRLVISTDSLQRQTTFTYWPGTHRVRTQTMPSGAIFTRGYDDVGRPKIETTAPGAGLDVGTRETDWKYDPRGPISDITYGGPAQGTLAHHVAFSYDSLGRRVREANSLMPFEVQHAYDINGAWKTTSLVADGLALTSMQHNYDSLRRLSGVSVQGKSIGLYNYGNSGPGGPLSANYANGAQALFTYDGRGRQVDLDVSLASGSAGSGGPIVSLHTAIGNDGIVRARSLSIGGQASISNLFQVDNFGRVVAENLNLTGIPELSGSVSNADVAPWIQQGTTWRQYGLDGVANWMNRTTAFGTDSTQPNALNAYAQFGGGSVGYDTADNATTVATNGGQETYSFDVYKRPLTAARTFRDQPSSATFAYDGLGRRIFEQDSSGSATYLIWDGDELIARGPVGADPSQYTLEVAGGRLGEHLASVDGLGAGAMRIYHSGPDGSTIALSDSKGALIEAYTYSAFGELTSWGPNGLQTQGPTTTDRFFWQGQLFDGWTSTYWLRTREYRPAWGRFLSTDTIGLEGGLNLYAFAMGAPLHMTDQFGTSANRLVEAYYYLKEGGSTLDQALDAILAAAGEEGSEPSPPTNVGLPKELNSDVKIDPLELLIAAHGEPQSVSEFEAQGLTALAKPGEQFNTPGQAASDAIRFIWKTKKDWREKEYGGWLYKTEDGKFVATDPKRGTEERTQNDPRPEDDAGRYHTHPQGGGEHFSQKDRSNALNGDDSYLGTPSQRIFRFPDEVHQIWPVSP